MSGDSFSSCAYMYHEYVAVSSRNIVPCSCRPEPVTCFKFLRSCKGAALVSPNQHPYKSVDTCNMKLAMACKFMVNTVTEFLLSQ
jgi:hypothetical protein